MRSAKNFNDYKKWYIGAVKSNLILRSGFMEDEADKIIIDFRLEQKIDECPDIALHDDPRSIAKAIVKKYATV